MDSEKKGLESGRYLANLRWHINPVLEEKEKEKEKEKERQLSLFTNKTIH